MTSVNVRTAIWREDRLYIVEDIPAQVCDMCMEQFYDDLTADVLRRLTEENFSSLEPKREIVVPVFSLPEQVRAPKLEDGEDVNVDY